MTLSGTRWTKEKCILPAIDKVAAGQLEEQTAIHLLVEAEVEVIEGLEGVTKARLFTASFQESITTSDEFISHQTGDEINRRHGFSLGLL